MTALSTATAAISDEQRWTPKLDTFPHTSKGAHLGQASEEQRSSNKREKGVMEMAFLRRTLGYNRRCMLLIDVGDRAMKFRSKYLELMNNEMLDLPQ